MPDPFTAAMVAAGAGVAAILAAKRRYNAQLAAQYGPLPGPATQAEKDAAAARGSTGTTVSPMAEGGVASYLVQRGNFVRGLDMTRVTLNPPHRITPHWGIDIAAPEGTPVYAARSGTVIHTGPRSGYGNAIGIRWDNGQSGWYAHLSRIDVTNGRFVIAGQQIGRVGNTTAGPDGVPPFTTSPHLHFEAHPGPQPLFGANRRLDPVSWLRQQGIAQSGGPV